MKLLRAARSIPLLAALFTLASACAAPVDAEDTAQARDGLTIVSSDEEGGRLVMDFRKEGRVIRYELVLGDEMENTTGDAPEEPRFLADARIRDANGATFYMQMGGDAWVDSTWHDEPVENVDVAGRTKDLVLPKAALTELRALHLSPRLEELRKHAVQIGLSVDSMFDEKTATSEAETAPTPIVPSEGGPTLGTKLSSYTTVYITNATRWDYKIYKISAGYWWNNWEHSAVLLRGFSSGGTLLSTRRSCNHGKCAAYSGTSLKCTMGGWVYSSGYRRFYSEGSESTGTRSGSCGTPWGVWGNQHLCNADSLVQARSIYYNADHRSTSWCTWGLSSSTAYAPGCH